MAGLPRGAFNLPPGVSLRDIEGAQECPHQHEDGADAFEQISYELGDGENRGIFRCGLCGEQQERECRD